MSDGDWGSSALQQAEVVASDLRSKYAIELHLIGIGGNEPVMVPRAGNKPMIINGKHIVSRLNTPALERLARASGGVYHHTVPAASLSLFSMLNIPKQRLDPAISEKILWDEWLAVPMLLGMLLLLLALQAESRRNLS